MKANGGDPKDHMVKFVFPEAIHPMKLGIFIKQNRVENCISSKELGKLSEKMLLNEVQS